ncbi:MAG: ABC transporter ATP-binding protein [Verrucomicrobia bacterium]|nr:ABC transporter ATP-binding protein [Verrucomicrobiota bacterium]MCH8528917.1 ABC transporter ATP-binding protein [Kiritimatiellia bacterium]
MKITLDQVSKSFGKTPALDQVSCHVHPGQTVAVIGLNGAGKTTLLRLLGGVLVPSGGRLHFDGRPFDRRDLAFRRRLFFLPEELPTLGEYSPLRHAAMVLPLWGLDVEAEKENLMDLYERFDLLPCLNSPIYSLSRGQIYKAILAPLLLIAPELWLIDEPFAAGMDPEGMMLFREKARAAAAKGSTVIFTTQILEIAEDFADLIYVLHEGRLVEILKVEELSHHLGQQKVSGEVVRLLGRLRSGGETK